MQCILSPLILRANKILESYKDPRSSYVQWYRTGQMRIASQAVDALNAIINDSGSGDDGDDGDDQ